MTDRQVFDVAVVGAGPAGLAAGLASAGLGLATVVAGPPASRADGRSAALFQSSIAFLKRLGVWNHVRDAAEPLTGIRLIDATGALLRAPEVTFMAHEIGLDAFGYSILNRDLTAGLEAASAGRLTRIVCPAVSVDDIGEDSVALSAATGERFSAALVAAADGRNSATRAAAHIGVRQWAYDQAAVVCNFEHTRPHRHVSTEFHRRAGPLTVVPAPAPAPDRFASSLVWVESHAEAQRLTALSDAEFTAALLQHLDGLLGELSAMTPRQTFPLSGQTATELARHRIALIGEAGHVIPPIGAQGLNLSFRDAAMLAELAAAARDGGADPGGPDVLAKFEKARRADVTSRIWTVDLLNRSLLSNLMPVHLARGLGLFGLSTLGPLRRLVMREGVAPAFSTPKLMRDFDAPAGLDGTTRLQA